MTPKQYVYRVFCTNTQTYKGKIYKRPGDAKAAITRDASTVTPYRGFEPDDYPLSDRVLNRLAENNEVHEFELVLTRTDPSQPRP